LGKAYKKFDEQVRSITEDKKTGLVLLQVDWRDPAMAALWANTLVDRLNREMRARSLAQATKSLSFLNGELEKTTDTDTRMAINRLVEMQIRQRMLADVTEEYAFRIVDRATAPDKWDRIRPKRVLLAISGLIAGLVFGVLSVAIRTSLSEQGHASREVSKG
jgi:LPS O-antigen subunit length determinant protein (WzzB/FepE family)